MASRICRKCRQSICFVVRGSAMKKGVFVLVAFLGALGIGLFWFDGFVENRAEEARKAGFAQCEAENAKKEVVEAKKEKEVQNENNIKKAVIWAERAIDDDTTQRLYDNGIL